MLVDRAAVMEVDEMNNDAISRSAVLEIFERNSITDLIVVGNKTVKQHIYDAPALDVAPVVHARWIPIMLYGGVHAIKCSACNNCDNPSKVPGNYCWQCGAKMDGEADA